MFLFEIVSYILCIVKIAFTELNRDGPPKGLKLPRIHRNFHYFNYLGFAKEKSSNIWGIFLRKIESGRDRARNALRVVSTQDCAQNILSSKEMTIRADIR